MSMISDLLTTSTAEARPPRADVSLLGQLMAARQCSLAMLAQPCAEKRRAEANRKAAATRKKQAEARKGQKRLGLNDALRLRVPVGADNALGQTEILLLLKDIEFSAKGLSGALTTLFLNGELCRIETRPYRYYRKDES